MSDLRRSGDEAFRRKLVALPKSRLKLLISAGALIAIVSASHVLNGMMYGTMTSNELSVFGLVLGLCVAAHFSMLLIAKRAMDA